MDDDMLEFCACGCGERLKHRGASPWFYSDDCQMRWMQKGSNPIGKDETFQLYDLRERIRNSNTTRTTSEDVSTLPSLGEVRQIHHYRPWREVRDEALRIRSSGQSGNDAS